MEIIKENKTLISVSFVLLLAFMLFASSILVPTSSTSLKATTNNLALTEVEGANAEMQLARVINNHTKYNWNQSQNYASRIVNMVMVGSDIAGAISIVLGFLSFGIITAITWAARMSLKWYIKRKGRREAVLW